MDKYWQLVKNKNDIERGMFIILPLRYDEKIDFKNISVKGKTVQFKSGDFIELMTNKCSMDGDFVRRYKLDAVLKPVKIDIEIPISDLQLFVFYNGIAFLIVYLSYSNKDVGSVYKFIYPGYIGESKELVKKQSDFLQEIEDLILNQIEPKMYWFVTKNETPEIILKEAYRMNVSYAPNRFKDTDILNRITYNEHRIIDLSREFEDLSEKDIEYVTGAKDIDSEDYRWGCSITSQEISFVYAKNDVPLAEQAEDDLMLTMLAMYQKYSCMMLNEEIHQRHTLEKGTAKFKKSIQELKWEAMEFIAYGTLAPSQISRWNNVCEIYRLLIELNGVNETITEIKEKINLLNEEQEHIDSRREGTIGMIIAVFGLISIIGAILQIVDYVCTGRIELLISFAISLVGVLIFGSILAGMFLIKKKHNGDV